MKRYTGKLKKYIKDFDFEKPRFKNAPKGFPNCDLRGLTKEEKHLFSAIVTAWVVSRPDFVRTVNAYIITNRLLYNRINATLFTLGLYLLLIIELVSLAYYINVEFNLGFDFLTRMFL
jgi:hypothetical protein